MAWDVTWDGPNVPSSYGFSATGESNGSMDGAWFVIDPTKSCSWREGSSGVNFTDGNDGTGEITVRFGPDTDPNSSYISWVIDVPNAGRAETVIYRDKIRMCKAWGLYACSLYNDYSHDFTKETRVRLIVDYSGDKAYLYLDGELVGSVTAGDPTSGGDAYNFHLGLISSGASDDIRVKSWKFHNTGAVFPPVLTTYGFTSRTYQDIVSVSDPLPKRFVFVADYEPAVWGEVDPAGYIKAMVSFNDCTDWTTVIDTKEGVDSRNLEIDIPQAKRGRDFKVKLEIETDAGIPDLTGHVEWLEGYTRNPRTGKVMPGVEVDIYEATTDVKVGSLVSDEKGHYALEVPPGSYTVRMKGMGFEGDENVITAGISSLPKYKLLMAKKHSDLSRILAAFMNVSWASYMIYDSFIDESKRDEEYSSQAVCNFGRLFKGRTYIDYFALMTDPSLWQGQRLSMRLDPVTIQDTILRIFTWPKQDAVQIQDSKTVIYGITDTAEITNSPAATLLHSDSVGITDTITYDLTS